MVDRRGQRPVKRLIVAAGQFGCEFLMVLVSVLVKTDDTSVRGVDRVPVAHKGGHRRRVQILLGMEMKLVASSFSIGVAKGGGVGESDN